MREDAPVGRRRWSLSLRTKLVLGFVALLMAIFVLVVAFGAGFIAGVRVDRSDAEARCVAAGGAWSAGIRICQMRGDARPEATAANGATAYACGDGQRFTVSDVRDGSLTFSLAGASSSVEIPRNEMFDDQAGGRMYVVGEDARLILTGDEASYITEKGAIACIADGS